MDIDWRLNPFEASMPLFTPGMRCLSWPWPWSRRCAPRTPASPSGCSAPESAPTPSIPTPRPSRPGTSSSGRRPARPSPPTRSWTWPGTRWTWRSGPTRPCPCWNGSRRTTLGRPWAAEAMLLRGQLLAARAADPGRSEGGPGRFRPGGGPVPRPPLRAAGSVRAGAVLPPARGQWGRALQNYIEAVRPGPRLRGRPGRPSCRRPRPSTSWATPPAACACCSPCATASPTRPKAGRPSGGSRCGSRSGIQKPPLRSQGPWPEGPAEVAQDADPSGHRPRRRALPLPGRPGPGLPPEGRPARRRRARR